MGGITSYEEQFQQRNLTSVQSLQQTILVLGLLERYLDSSSASENSQIVNGQRLNQLLLGSGYNGLSAEAVSVPPIEDDSSAFHFLGDTNGASIGGYMIIFHRGPVVALILTAAVKGAESLPQTIDIAQKQAERLRTIR